jgi:hypothetical protein
MLRPYVIDLSREPLVSRRSPEIARLFDGKPPSAAAFSNWAVHGIRGVKLPSLLVGGKRLTSPGAMGWWIQATNAESQCATTALQSQAAIQRERDVEAAIAILERPAVAPSKHRPKSRARR